MTPYLEIVNEQYYNNLNCINNSIKMHIKKKWIHLQEAYRQKSENQIPENPFTL